MQPQLVYIYIHKYKGLSRQGFNLNSKYQVNFTQESDSLNTIQMVPRLSIQLRHSILPHLFDPYITDIRGIIGENGAGKSTLMEYLTLVGHDNNLNYGHIGAGNHKDIFIYEIQVNGVNQLYVMVGSSWQFEAIEQFATAPIGTQFSNMDDFLYEEFQDFSKTKIIYYSNVFDNKIQVPYNDLKLISTNFLVRKDQEQTTNAKVQVNVLDSHKIMEARRQLEFVLQYRNQVKLPIDLPTEIHILYNSISRQSLSNKINAADESPELHTIKTLLTTWLNNANDNELFLANKAEVLLQRVYFHYFIDNLIADENEVVNSNFPGFRSYKIAVFKKLIALNSEGNGIANLNELIAFVEEEEHKIELNPENQKITLGDNTLPIGLGDAKLSNYLKSFKDFYELLFSQKTEIIVAGPLGLSIRLNKTSLDLYIRYFNSLFITTYLDFSFPELSSGELGFLTLFSRFYSLVSGTNRYSVIESHVKNLIIFIDEGDLYFHPSWQSKFIYYINQMLPKIFPNTRLQIFISSHSPFIASDLPTNHLLFMRRIDQSNISSDERQAAGEVMNVPNRTFGANIHELLSHSFFMKGAHIGELAKQTLFQLLDHLDGKKSIRSFSNEEIVALIEEIGEPWMRSRLLEKFEIYLRRQN